MGLLSEAKAHNIAVRSMVLTLIGAGLNLVLFAVVFPHFSQDIINYISNPQQAPIPFITTSPMTTVAYLGMTILYSVIASLFYRPKRIISPVHIQLLTATLLGITIAYYIILNPHLAYEQQYIGALTFALMVIYSIVWMVGFIQQQFVRYIIGLQGTEMDLKTYSINVDFETVDEILKNSAFRERHKLRKSKRIKDRKILQTKWWGSSVKLVIVIQRDNKLKNHTTLAIASYSIDNGTVKVDDETLDERKAVEGYLQRQLADKYHTAALSPLEDNNTEASEIAWAQARRSTQSPISTLRSQPRAHIAIVSVVAAAAAGMSIWYVFDNSVRDAWINTMIFVGVVLAVEVYPLIRERILSRQEDESD